MSWPSRSHSHRVSLSAGSQDVNKFGAIHLLKMVTFDLVEAVDQNFRGF